MNHPPKPPLALVTKHFLAPIQRGAFFLGSLAMIGCLSASPVKGGAGMQREMRDASEATRALYRYVWSGREFFRPEGEPEIQALLDRLGGDFHRVARQSEGYSAEPGFRLNLRLHQELLIDAGKRFRQGHKEYAQWKLRGIAGSCIACHSRLQAPVDVLGELPPEALGKVPPEEELGRAEYLFATRQFDRASSALWKIAEKNLVHPEKALLGERALELWLVVEVRSKARFAESATQLQRLLSLKELSEEHRDVLRVWGDDLVAAKNQSGALSLAQISTLLPGAGEELTLQEERKNLVRSLRASAALHLLLSQTLLPEERKQAVFALARAYYHTPITLFEPQQQLYLETVIREYPHTWQAERAFQLYATRVQEESSGSGGMHLDEDFAKKLAELSELSRRVVPAKGQRKT